MKTESPVLEKLIQFRGMTHNRLINKQMYSIADDNDDKHRVENKSRRKEELVRFYRSV